MAKAKSKGKIELIEQGSVLMITGRARSRPGRGTDHPVAGSRLASARVQSIVHGNGFTPG